MNQELEGWSPTSSSALSLIGKKLNQQFCRSKSTIRKGETSLSTLCSLSFNFIPFGHKSVCYLVISFWEEQCVCLSAICVEHNLCVLVYVVLSHYVRVCVAGRLTVCVCVCVWPHNVRGGCRHYRTTLKILVSRVVWLFVLSPSHH